MIKIRKSEDRGHFDHGWLDTFHTYSFAAYYDPDHMGFRSLRVLNDDTVQPGGGFHTHPHEDMEVISYVMQGSLKHRDSMGNEYVIKAGEVQRMTCGTGITHSEFNPSDSEITHFFQIWITPDTKGLEPSYEQKCFSENDKRGLLSLIASNDGAGNSIRINQDARLYATILHAGEQVEHNPATGRHAWVHVAKGEISLNGHILFTGDGAAITAEESLKLVSVKNSEILLFDLA